MADEDVQKEQLLCRKCVAKKAQKAGFGAADCELHGNEFIDWKCMFCCTIALFVCAGGTGYYCTPCHNDAMAAWRQRKAKTQCTGGKNCPLGVPEHPVGGTDHLKARFPLGCSLCRSN